jgi:hypothetical protein
MGAVAANGSAEAAAADVDEGRRRRNRDVGDYVREEPLTALAIASGAGFILGGGANSKIGLALLTIVGRIALRGAATSFIVGLVNGNHDNQTPDCAKGRVGSYRNGNHDNRRTDFSDPN